MPWKPLKPCRHPGCPNLSGRAYCEKHRKAVTAEAAKAYNRNQRDTVAQKFYESPAWKRLRQVKLNNQPLCEMCLKDNRFTKAEIADHIEEIRRGGSPLDLNNLQSLCRSCHTVKSNRERANNKNG